MYKILHRFFGFQYVFTRAEYAYKIKRVHLIGTHKCVKTPSGITMLLPGGKIDGTSLIRKWFPITSEMCGFYLNEVKDSQMSKSMCRIIFEIYDDGTAQTWTEFGTSNVTKNIESSKVLNLCKRVHSLCTIGHNAFYKVFKSDQEIQDERRR